MATPDHPEGYVETRPDAAWKSVEFESAGVTIRGRLYGPTAPTAPRPAVVMAHGFSATISGMVADLYAEAFAEAGLVALLYDHAGFGISDGEPRHQVDSWLQARGYVDAVSFAATLEDIDSDNVAVWGDSKSGGVALVVAAVDERVKAVVVQVPGCGREISGVTLDDAAFADLQEIVLRADLGAFRRIASQPMPVVSPDQLNMPSHLTPLTAFLWFIQFGGRFGTNWENRATWADLVTPVPFDVTAAAPYLTVPTQMLIADNDEMPGANADVARHVLAGIRGPKEAVELDGGHFGLLYPGSPAYTKSITAQREFLVRHLGHQAADE
jgi:alpha-beta hydrolase superfamily lysophospholipase